jgi:hypothetical protein
VYTHLRHHRIDMITRKYMGTYAEKEETII